MNFSLQTSPGNSPGAAAGTPREPGWDLPPSQRPSRRRRLGGKLLALGGLVVLATVGTIFIATSQGMGRSVKGLFLGSGSKVLSYKVKRAKLPVTFKEKGNLESSNNIDVYCNVEGSTVILTILPEGSRVKKGDIVCKLDSAALEDNLTNQVITTKQAEAAWQNAKLTREVAEIAVIEYVEGTYKQDYQTAQGNIALALSDLERAIDRVRWSERMYKMQYVSQSQLLSDRQTLAKAKFTSEQAQTSKDVLEKYTRQKMIKQLQSEVEKARADELAKQATLELERSKEKKLRTQIENCTLRAPADGIVVYANDPNRFGNNQIQIEEGATVRQSQKIFSLPDISKMRVNTKIHEALYNRVAPGQRAKIRVDAFASQELDGVIEEVQPLPDPTSFFSSDVKVYTSYVSIENPLPGLRPGMTAEVEILVAELDNVVSVPLQAIVAFRGKSYVYVLVPNGTPQRKEVTLGISNDQVVEVREGLQPGEEVALNPVSVMTEDEKREAFGLGSKGEGKKGWGKGGARGKGGPPGAGGPPGTGKGGPGGKAKGKWGGRGGFDPAMIEKFKNASPEEKQQMIERFKAANPGGFGPPGGGFGPPDGGPNGGGGGFGGPNGGGGANP